MTEKKEITIYDIAKKLGISASTVSRAMKDNSAISDSMVKKIRKSAERMGYQPNVFAASIRQKKTFTVGVLIPRITSEFMSKAVTAIQKVLNNAGYNIIISQSDESFQKEVENTKTLFNSRVDGLIVSLANETDNYDHFMPFIEKNIPIVFFDRVCSEIKAVRITINDYESGYAATEHLIMQGYKRIAILAGSQKRNVYKNRVEGYKQALKKHRLHADPSLIMETPMTIESGRKSALTLMNMKNRPDAVFACNDATAIGCIMEFKKTGLKIPGDIAMVGFNNDSSSEIIDPALTTINYPVVQMGAIAAEKLLDALVNPVKPGLSQNICLKTDLIVRKSG